MADQKPESGKDVERGETKDIPFENVLNFRDVGKTVNDFAGKKYGIQTQMQWLKLTLSPRMLAERKVFRSARPGEPHCFAPKYLQLMFSDDATLSDRKRLKEEYGIKTIIDLRTVYNFRCPFSGLLMTLSAPSTQIK